MNNTDDKLEITELMNKLFMFTDAREWEKLQSDVFMEKVEFDMSSMGGGQPSTLTAKNICMMWEEGFKDLDSVHHQGGHYLITVENNRATIFAYAVALHYKKSAKEGTTRLFTGSYDVKALRTADGWRLNAFKYNLKFISGNEKLE